MHVKSLAFTILDVMKIMNLMVFMTRPIPYKSEGMQTGAAIFACSILFLKISCGKVAMRASRAIASCILTIGVNSVLRI